MREIKFRAWLPHRKHFNYCNVHIDGTGLLFWQFGHTCEVIEKEERDEIVIQQFTGLHDKNGKEIYEGDIVKQYLHSIEDNDLYLRVGVVEYREDRFWCFGKNCHFYLNGALRDIPKSSYEVIGDIYSNPELLKEVKE